MMHLGAFGQSVVVNSTLVLIDAITDQAIFTSGDDLRVPDKLTNLLGEAALSASTSPTNAQLQSPSLRDLANQDIFPIAAAATFSDSDAVQWHGDNPRALVSAESLNYAVTAADSTAAQNYGLVWLGDGPVKPTSGKIFSVLATGAATLAANTWVNTALTFNSTLPAGSYQVVGLWAEGDHLVAARLVFIGGQFRPGVPANGALAANNFPRFRMGRIGVFGEFDINQPPTMDCLGATDTAQTFILDLIKTK